LEPWLFVLTPDKYADFTVTVHADVKNDRPAADLAILDVILVRHGRVEQYVYVLSAIGA
jgi:hypothetical protein